MLPENGTVWPPPSAAEVLGVMAGWDALYAGRPLSAETTRRIGGYDYAPGNTWLARNGGILSGIRNWLSRDVTRSSHYQSSAWTDGESRSVHVPIAANLATMSADLLFSEAPSITVETRKKDKKTQQRLEEIVGDGLHSVLVAAAEASAALGGVFLVATWDAAIADHVIIDRVDADQAVPRFRRGRLTGVTFWRTLESDSPGEVWRHLEDHFVDEEGIGQVQHGLYKGSVSELGDVQPLTDHPSTVAFVPLVDENACVSTGTPGLDVVYVPNIKPAPLWRRHPIGSSLGRSDYSGVETLFDAIDDVYEFLMRDFDLGRARVIVSEAMLDDDGPGSGVSFDTDRAIFTTVSAAPGSVADERLSMEFVQPVIRVTEAIAAAAELVSVIVRSAGYSLQTLGKYDGQVTTTATEVKSRERRSYITRDRKLREWKPALESVISKALAMDAELFGSGIDPTAPVSVEFGDAVQDSLSTLAEIVGQLKAAGAASLRTRLLLLHPEWDEEQLAEETELILAETGMTALWKQAQEQASDQAEEPVDDASDEAQD